MIALGPTNMRGMAWALSRAAFLLGVLSSPATEGRAVGALPPGAGGASAAGTPEVAASSRPIWDAEDFIVGTPDALEVWNRDGKRKAILSPGQAQSPRWLGPEAIVVLRPRGASLGDGATVELVEPNTGRRKRVGRIPAFHCASTDTEVDLQDETDFQVDADQGRACLSLMDRNINMAEVAVDVVVDLKTGRVRRWLSLGEETCHPPKGVVIGTPRPSEGCAVSSHGVPNIGDDTQGFAFRAKNVDDDVVIEGKSPGTVLVPSYQRAGDSPSGRFELLRGEQEDGDYIHFKALVFDRQSGQLFPVTSEAGAWPKPLRAVGKGRRHIETPVEKAGDLVGETPLHWLGPPAHEVLRVDKSILVPHARIFTLPGDVIF